MLKTFQNSASMLAAYLVMGAIVGVLIIHPLTLIVVWWELSRFSESPTSLIEFLEARLWLLVLPRHFDIAIALALIGALVGFAFGLFTRNYVTATKAYQSLREEQTVLIPDIIKGGETSRVEFKSTVRWDVKENRINRGLEKVIAKTVSGFFNTQGGYLLIGVDDDGTPLGLDKDLSTLRQSTLDAFERTIVDIVTKMLGGDLSPYIHTVFTQIDEKDVAMIIVRPAPRAVYLTDGNKTVFYVRSGNSTRSLDVKEALTYARERWS